VYGGTTSDLVAGDMSLVRSYVAYASMSDGTGGRVPKINLGPVIVAGSEDLLVPCPLIAELDSIPKVEVW
jgi:hypothetical protein